MTRDRCSFPLRSRCPAPCRERSARGRPDRGSGGANAGRPVAELVRRHRHSIFSGLIRNGDLRRAVTTALLPVLSGARISDDVFDYEITGDDLERIGKIQAVLKREGLEEIAKEIGALAFVDKRALGKRLAEIFELDDC